MKSASKLFIFYVEQALNSWWWWKWRASHRITPPWLQQLSTSRRFLGSWVSERVWKHSSKQSNAFVSPTTHYFYSTRSWNQGNEYIMDPSDPKSARHHFGIACFQAIRILLSLSYYKRRPQAMAMSYRPRLGSESLLSLMPPYVMQNIHGWVSPHNFIK